MNQRGHIVDLVRMRDNIDIGGTPARLLAGAIGISYEQVLREAREAVAAGELVELRGYRNAVTFAIPRTGVMEESKMSFVSKPGKHGTLHLFLLRYRDKDDPASPTFEWKTWAYDSEHALDRFHDFDDEGWKVVSWERVQDSAQHRAKRHEMRETGGDAEFHVGDTVSVSALSRHFTLGEMREAPSPATTKNTGHYRIELGGTEENPSLMVTAIGGMFPSGEPIEVWLEVEEGADLNRWFSRIRGDFEVEEMLATAGYDTDGNPIRGARPEAVEVGSWVRETSRGPSRLSKPFFAIPRGERVRVRVKNPSGKPLEAFWLTLDQDMTHEQIARQSAQAAQPGMIIDVASKSEKLAFRVTSGQAEGFPYGRVPHVVLIND